ncbi:MAG TPA: prepilin-type cleavage/methylation domain-containing protein [Cyanobacteria bacterium UBA8803]|nr:prepilin-type cleavage/methylation domain-containing protein [Cyanobacteria bacterium UBA9273]HBL60224.1 prepilin-type cleavage/methylation domain-containing protein [Cyanobacteria bacterium UBA8803]
MPQNNQPQTPSRSTAGFTLLELIIVAVILGILSAIAVPSWLSFLDRQRLNTAQSQVYQAMQEAKSNAKRDKITWQVSFREVDRVVQWSIHPAKSGEFIPSSVHWNHLGENIRIYTARNQLGKYETTLDSPGAKSLTGPWRVQFNYHGNTNGQLGQITLTTNNGSNSKRCVYVSTLIGAMRMGQEQSKSNSDKKYCY